jgi:ribosomal protein S18 acetylase RimI-like enzyme
MVSMAWPEDLRLTIRELRATDRPWLQGLINREWGLPVVSISGTHDPSSLPGFLAEEGDEPLGAVTYHLTTGHCEVVTLNSLRPRRGVGTALLAAVKRVADRDGRRLWLITTDDNVDALRFYRRRGMDRRAIHRDFVEEVRRQKPGIDDHPAEAPPSVMPSSFRTDPRRGGRGCEDRDPSLHQPGWLCVDRRRPAHPAGLSGLGCRRSGLL